MTLTSQEKTLDEIKLELEAMDQPYAAVLDYLDSTSEPTVDGFFEYMEDEESSYASQSRWDASQTHSPIAAGKPLDGSGQSAMMNNLTRGS